MIVAFTKFDLVVAIEDGSSARANARRRIEQSCRSHFRREPRDVPAEIVSGSFFFFLVEWSLMTCFISETTIW